MGRRDGIAAGNRGATMAPSTFASGEVYAMPAATQQLLEDSEINFDVFLANEIGEEIGRQEGLAFISGNGTNEPNGV